MGFWVCCLGLYTGFVCCLSWVSVWSCLLGHKSVGAVLHWALGFHLSSTFFFIYLLYLTPGFDSKLLVNLLLGFWIVHSFFPLHLVFFFFFGMQTFVTFCFYFGGVGTIKRRRPAAVERE
jgi:hypothetical protein